MYLRFYRFQRRLAVCGWKLKKVCLMQIKLSLIKYQVALFNRAMIAVNKELSASGVDCASLRWDRKEVLSKL